MHAFRYTPSIAFPTIWMPCASFFVAIALCVVTSDAFTTFGGTCNRVLNGGVNEYKYNKEHLRTRRSQRLSMVAHMPTSNVTLDDMMVADSVFVDEVDIEDIKYIDESDQEEVEDLSTMDTLEIKKRLLELVAQMKGTSEEYRKFETYVNTLEERYAQPQTLDFLNLIMSGEWQLLFSTNLPSRMQRGLRVTELIQRVETNGLNGTVVNEATWAFAQNYTGTTLATTFDTNGKFAIKCSYSINQGARMVIDLNDHVLTLGKGSAIPDDISALVGVLFRSIPTEIYNPEDHAMDTTYLDGDLRIVRMTGPRYEAVRNVFIRRGSMQLNPM